jgi:hypothetical protein
MGEAVMTITLGKPIAVVLLLALSSTLLAQDQAEPKEFVGEGVVVAFQKYNRYPVTPRMGGVATFVEFWIVRIDKWTNEVEPLKNKIYFRVQYDLYERGLTDCEINASRLRIKLRERREDEHTDCLGSRRELSDYVRTTPGQQDSIPPLESLPCLIAHQPPKVISE